MPTYVRLRVGSERYVIPVEHVIEIAEPGALTVVPGSDTAVLGIATLRGSILAVYDLGRVLEVERDDAPGRLLVAEHEGRRIGLSVDEVSDVGDLDGPSEDTGSPLLLGAAIVDDALIGFLDIEAVFAALGG